jgi:hypothetical protein
MVLMYPPWFDGLHPSRRTCTTIRRAPIFALAAVLMGAASTLLQLDKGLADGSRSQDEPGLTQTYDRGTGVDQFFPGTESNQIGGRKFAFWLAETCDDLERRFWTAAASLFKHRWRKHIAP